MGFWLPVSCPVEGCRYNTEYRYTDQYDLNETGGEHRSARGREHLNHDWNRWTPPLRSPMAKSWTKVRMVHHLKRDHRVPEVECAGLTARQLWELHEEAEGRDQQEPQ
jgi:hypothetical protein